MSALTWLGIALAGGVGAPARYLLDGFVQDRVGGPVPWGTFAVNVVGALLLGCITGLSVSGHLGPMGKAVAGTGFCGAFTTFSTFTYESTRLLEERSWGAAAWNIGGSLGVGLIAAAIGITLGLHW